MINLQSKHPNLPITSVPSGVESCKFSVLMGDFLIMMIHDNSSEKDSGHPATLWAVDLQDNTVVGGIRMEEFYFHRDYTFTKYGENKIMKFGGERCGQSFDREVLSTLHQITVESFKRIVLIFPKAFKIKCEKIEVKGEKQKKLYAHTAQIYEDALYVYGGNNRKNRKKDLWRFDLKNFTWKLCETIGEGPGPRDHASSFLIEDKMYIYGGKVDGTHSLTKNDIFLLNLNSLTWTRIQQQSPPENQISLAREDIIGGIYQGNLIIPAGESELSCWNIDMNSWSTAIEKKGLLRGWANLFFYKNLLIVTGIVGRVGTDVFLAFLDLNKSEFPRPESSEQKRLTSLFMNEKESDITLKVQDKLIPAHKKILIQKSKYFAGLFNSGMIESRQEVIEIDDCEFSTFQELLRFIYYDQVEGLDAHLAIKLICLADKYLIQSNLNEKCMNFLTFNIDSENIYIILDFARKQDISHLRRRCMELLQQINLDNVSGLIRYLDENPNSEFIEENLKLREKAFEKVLYNYAEIFKLQKKNLKFYADFLIRNINFTTIKRFANFIYEHNSRFKKLTFNYKKYAKDYASMEEAQSVFEYATTNLQKHVVDFARENIEILREKEILQFIAQNFLVDLLFYEMKERKKCEGIIKNLQKSAQETQIIEEEENQVESETSQKKTHKRKEPSHDDMPNENPFLKQTKKDSSLNEDTN